MRNLKLTLAYDGTRLVGWQRQAEGDSVQGLLEDALARFEGAPVTVHGAGRTDAGVHALGQVASAQVTFTHDGATLTRALNAQLPEDVRVLAVEDVSPEFHARFKARSKTYRYQIRHGTIADPFERAYVWHMPERLRVEAMRAAAGVLVGTHDFAAFQSIGTPVRDSVRTVTQSTLTDAEPRGGLDRITHGVDAGAMPLDARQMPLRGPSAVAVHDDGDVCREPVELDLTGESLVGVPRRNPRQEILKRHGAIPLCSSS